MDEQYCIWTYESSDDGDIWESACGHTWQFETDTPKGNEMNFCPFCGHILAQMPYDAGEDIDALAESEPKTQADYGWDGEAHYDEQFEEDDQLAESELSNDEMEDEVE